MLLCSMIPLEQTSYTAALMLSEAKLLRQQKLLQRMTLSCPYRMAMTLWWASVVQNYRAESVNV